MLKVGFLGSSSSDGFEDYKQDLTNIIEFLFSCDKNLMLFSGGYQGLMEEVCSLALQVKNQKNKESSDEYKLNTLGVLFDGYQNDPKNAEPNYLINTPNEYNDLFISSSTIGERTHVLTTIPDVVVAFPGSTGTLHEILHLIEHIKYGEDYDMTGFKKLLVHPYWRDTLQNLTKQGILKKKYYECLEFWSNEDRQLKELKVTIKENKDKKEGDNKNEINYSNKTTENDRSHFVEITGDGNSQIDENIKSYHDLFRNLNRLFQGRYHLQDPPNYVIGLDIVILDLGGQNLIKLTTIGTKKYIEVLEEFLGENKSILLNGSYLDRNSNHFECRNLDNLNIHNDLKDLIYKDFSNQSLSLNEDSSSEFNDWTTHLKKKNLGKSVVWLTVPALANRYVISTFVSFEHFVPENQEERLKNILTGFLYNQILTELHERLTAELERHALQAAVSQVTARNYAHHIGSHVKNRATLDKIRERIAALYPDVKEKPC